MNNENMKILPEKKSAANARKEYLCNIADKIRSLIVDEHFKSNEIMVLVQRRNPFAGPLIKELQARGIEVAGNDRIILPDFPAIRDLLNLVRFCIDTDDDYSLCCTLKSPIYCMNEADIFNICKMTKDAKKNIKNDKKNITVFETLQKTKPDVYTELMEIIEWSKTLAPYSFFSKLLNTNNRREKIISALGVQVIDPLEEFMTICLAYERTKPGTLRHFIKWFITGGSEIKRDMDASSGVRIVTVHGSKGLEAPVVFLIDTITTPKPERVLGLDHIVVTKDSKLLDNESELKNLTAWLWTPQKNNSEKLERIAEVNMNKKISEYYRLLYVAITRARDRLYIYGFTPNKNPPEIAWHTQLFSILSNTNNINPNKNIITIANDK